MALSHSTSWTPCARSSTKAPSRRPPRRLHVTQSAVSQRIKQSSVRRGRCCCVGRRRSPRPTPATCCSATPARSTCSTPTRSRGSAGVGSATAPIAPPTSLRRRQRRLDGDLVPRRAGRPRRAGGVRPAPRRPGTRPSCCGRDVLAAVTATREPVQGCSSRAARRHAVPSRRAPGSSSGGWAAGDPRASAPPSGALRSHGRPAARLRATPSRAASRSRPGTTCPRRRTSPGPSCSASAGACCRSSSAPRRSRRAAGRAGPRDPVDVALYWQRWNIASPTLDRITAAVRSRAAGSLR